MSTLIQQYKGIKQKYPDAILLFRVGDNYEVFNEDAETATKILGFQLASHENGKEVKYSASFPHFSLDIYLHKLARAGHRVAVCDELEDPKTKPKNVKCGVTDFIK